MEPITVIAVGAAAVNIGVRLYDSLFGGGVPDISEAQRKNEVKGLRQTRSGYGQTVRLVFGSARISPSLIFLPSESYSHHRFVDSECVFYALGLGLCEGPIVGIGSVWNDGEVFDSLDEASLAEWKRIGVTALAPIFVESGVPGSSGLANTPAPDFAFTLRLGTMPSPVYDWRDPFIDTTASSAQYADIAYPGTAWVARTFASWVRAGGNVQGDVPNYQFEVRGFCADEDGRASARDVVETIFSDALHGAGLSLVDRTDATSFSKFEAYTQAVGFRIGWEVEQQRSALDLLRFLLDACNSSAVDSGGRLKLIPYGDQDITANGYTYTANHVPVYDLGDDDFVCTPGAQPIRIERRSDLTSPNCVPVEYPDGRFKYSEVVDGKRSASAYENVPVEATILSDAVRPLPGGGRKGIIKAAPVSLPCFIDQSAAQLRSRLYAQRSVGIKCRYTLRMNWKGILLEKGDLVRISSTAMGLSSRVCRITGRRRDRNAGAQGEIELVMEDAPVGVYTAAAYSIEEGDATAGPPLGVAPTSANAPLAFVPPLQATGYRHELWVAASHPDPASCSGLELWLSWDGTTYERAGAAYQAAVGEVVAPGVTAGPPLDGINVLRVNMALSSQSVDNATTADRDSLATLSYVGGELFSYATSVEVVGSAGTYDVSSLRRGCLGTVSEAHVAGEKFVVCDDRVFRLAVPEERLGTTAYLKVLAWNATKTQLQSLEDVSATTVSLPARPGAPISLPVSISWADFNREEWSIWGEGAGTVLTIETGGSRGGKVLRIAGGPVWMRYERDIAVDSQAGGDVLGLVARVRQVTDPVAGGKLVRAGVTGVDQDGATLKSPAGATITSSSTTPTDYFWAINGTGYVAGSGWHEVVGYWQGSAASGTNAGTALLSPGTWHTGTRYVRPTLGFNLTGGNGVVEIDTLGFWDATGDQVSKGDTSALDATMNILASSKTAVFYSDAPPSNPTGAYYLRAGDIWFNTDTTTYCADSNCKGHTADVDGNAEVGSYPHRCLYWAHRWTGAAWVDAKTVQTIIASEIAVGYLSALTADLGDITAGSITLNTYTESSGSVTRGVKIYDPADADSACIMVDPRGIQVGGTKLSEAWFGNQIVAFAGVYSDGSALHTYRSSYISADAEWVQIGIPSGGSLYWVIRVSTALPSLPLGDSWLVVPTASRVNQSITLDVGTNLMGTDIRPVSDGADVDQSYHYFGFFNPATGAPVSGEANWKFGMSIVLYCYRESLDPIF